MNISNKLFDYISIPFVVIMNILILTGCSTLYTVKDFTSKDNYYEKFNTETNNKSLNVALLNGNSFVLNKNAVLLNDTLYSLMNLEVIVDSSIAISEIENIYSSTDSKFATIILKNGKNLNCRDITYTHDSINYITTEFEQRKQCIIPLNKVKTISYTNKWLRVPLGVLTGALLGCPLGLLYSRGLTSKDDSGLASSAGAGGALVGGIIGGLIGYWIGYEYIYQFNP